MSDSKKKTGASPYTYYALITVLTVVLLMAIIPDVLFGKSK
jgi:hypothetical protein